jgi:hypothetical protein
MVPKFRFVMGVKVSWGKRAEMLVAMLSLSEDILGVVVLMSRIRLVVGGGSDAGVEEALQGLCADVEDQASCSWCGLRSSASSCMAPTLGRGGFGGLEKLRPCRGGFVVLICLENGSDVGVEEVLLSGLEEEACWLLWCLV